MIQPLLVNTYDPIGGAGAARAAYRLHQGLLGLGIDSKMLVQDKRIDDSTVISFPNQVKMGKYRPSLDSLPLKLYPNRQRKPAVFPLQWLPNTLTSQITTLNPDIINLHWICDGFVPIEALARFNKPIVWTFHDMWAFTGGCCYSGECARYTKSCGTCPQLGSNLAFDLSRWVWWRKAKAWQQLKLTIVTPSKWLAECAKSSSLFQNTPIEVIPNGLDIGIYKPIERQTARSLLKLPQNKQLVLFGTLNLTSYKRKGFHLLQPALKLLSHFEGLREWELVILGASEPKEKLDLGLKIHYLGTLRDDASIALVYAAADVFVAPSIQDNLPNAVMEALACGTPCVAFKIGGMPDLIEHKQNGYLAHPFAIEDLAKGIAWVLEDKQRWQVLSTRAREKVEQEFTLEKQANRYLSLFKEVCKISEFS
jgi:glycosyltransferase involved in cell wall biosynthesis